MKRSVTLRLNEWRNDQWIATIESLNSEDQSQWRMEAVTPALRSG
jgi:hypothetical protein